ncbi:MAG: PD-(D/E)XK nuclease family protein [bacterium]
MQNELKIILNQLKENPIFRMSLCSKELFHSNFWAWMLEQYPDSIKCFVQDYKKDNYGEFEKVYREKQSFDLVIETDKKFIVIENKFKSMPIKGQLNKYSKKDGNIDKFINERSSDKKEVKLLISYIEPYFDVNEIGWEYITYERLSEKLNDFFKDVHDKNPYIKNYLEMLNSFIQIKKLFALEKNPNYKDFFEIFNNDKNLQDLLSDMNFESTLKRIYMSEVYKYIRKNIKEKLPDIRFYIRDDIDEKNNEFLKFNNCMILNLDYSGLTKNVFIDFFVYQEKMAIGFTISASHYRITLGSYSKEKDLSKIVKNLIEDEKFEFFNDKNITPKNKKYYSFGENWKYQILQEIESERKISELSSLLICDLEKLLKHDLKTLLCCDQN